MSKTWWPVGFVWGIWAVMTAVGLYWATRYGIDLPFLDGWILVPVLTGNEPLNWAWLWHPHTVHRFTFPWLVLLGLYRIGHYDFSTGVQLGPLLMSALAAAMIATARRLRGRTSAADAFFPLLLLHWGASESFLWTWQLVFFIPITLTGIILLAIVNQGPKRSTASGLAIGLSLLLLPFSGAMGAVTVPVLACWLIYAGVSAWRDGRRAAGAGISLLAISAIGLVGFYFVDFHPLQRAPFSPLSTALTAWQFLTAAFGAVGVVVPDYWRLWGIVYACLLLSAMSAMGCASRRQDERLRATGLTAFILAQLTVALAVGLGRPGQGLALRYSLLAAPCLCGIYLIFLLYAGRHWKRFAPAILCVIMAGWLLPNTWQGLHYQAVLSHNIAVLKSDIRSGTPLNVLADRYSQRPFAIYPDRAHLARFMKMAHNAGIGVFRDLAIEPTTSEGHKD
jgi:hypothetical protein